MPGAGSGGGMGGISVTCKVRLRILHNHEVYALPPAGGSCLIQKDLSGPFQHAVCLRPMQDLTGYFMY